MRRRNDPFEKPWVMIAAAAGIIVVIGMGLLFFLGGDSSGPGPSVPATPAATQQHTPVPAATPGAIRTQIPVTTPSAGVFVHVSYLGSFAGTYGTEDNLITTRNSGDRFFAVENATGTISASFRKEDGSTNHELMVEILSNGTSRAAARNSSAFGTAAVTYTL